MATNRFSKLNDPGAYQGLSFQEMAYAPTILRQREDALMNQQDLMMNQMYNTQVAEPFQAEVNKLRQDLNNEFTAFADKISKEGVGNLKTVDEFRNLRNKFNQLHSASGAIGKAAAAKAQHDQAKQAYFQDGFSKGYEMEDILRNYNAEYDNYRKGLPSTLDNFEGAIPDFIPSFAPQHVNLADEINKYSDLVLKVKQQTGSNDIKFEKIRDEKGGYKYIIVNEKGPVSNTGAVERLATYMKNELLNPNSGIHKALMYKGLNPNEYLDDAEDLTKMMLIEQQGSRSYAGQIDLSGNTKSGGGGGPKPRKPEETASFVTYDGYERLVGKNPEDTKKAMDAIKNADIPQDEKDTQMLQLQHLYVKQQEFLKSDEFKDRVDTDLSNMNKGIIDVGDEEFAQIAQKHGLNSLADANSFIEKVNQTPITMGEQSEDGFTGVLQSLTGNFNTLSPESQQLIRERDAVKRYINNESNDLANNYFAGSKMHQFGPSTKSRDLQKVFSDAGESYNIKKLAENGRFEILNDDGKYEVTGENIQGVESDMYEDFQTLMNDSENVEWKAQAIDDGGLKHDPTIMYTVSFKNGDKTVKRNVAIKLTQDDDLTDQILNPNTEFYESLDSQGQKTFDFLRDKIQFRGIPTDLDASDPAAYNSADTNSIKRHFNRELSKIGINQVAAKDAVNDYLFVKSGEKADVAIEVGRDNAYTMHKKVGDQIQPYRFSDLLNKEAVHNWKRKYPGSKISVMQKTPGHMDEVKISLVEDIHKSLGNIDTLEQSIGQQAFIYNESPAFIAAMREYHEKVNQAITIDAQRQIALDTWKKINSFTVRSKQINQFF